MSPANRHHDLTEIFIAVFELQGKERREELDRLCRNRPDLRGELDQLLAIHDSASQGSNANSESSKGVDPKV